MSSSKPWALYGTFIPRGNKWWFEMGCGWEGGGFSLRSIWCWRDPSSVYFVAEIITACFWNFQPNNKKKTSSPGSLFENININVPSWGLDRCLFGWGAVFFLKNSSGVPWFVTVTLVSNQNSSWAVVSRCLSPQGSHLAVLHCLINFCARGGA